MNNFTDEVAKKLFKNNVITKIELQNFLAEEEAFQKLYNYNLDRINKKQDIELKHLEVYKKQIESYKLLLSKLNLLSDKKKDILLMKLTDDIIANIDSISEQIIQKFDKYISVKTKKELEGRY
ncbi:MAG: hypothetical protein ACRCZ9_00020 [Fusobacteriaceae bacterium]